MPADSARFHEAPEGLAAPFPPPGSGGPPGDYILWPLERAGYWMRVSAVTPSDYCADPPAPREDTLWIRWPGASGRPRVWFLTRGAER